MKIEDELHALEVVDRSATPPPWRDDNGYRLYADTPNGAVLLFETKQQDGWPRCPSYWDTGAIALMRNKTSALLAEIRLLRAALVKSAESTRFHHGCGDEELHEIEPLLRPDRKLGEP